MIAVRIAHAEPWPGRLRDGGFAISDFLVVLADDAGGRALPLWLTGADGKSLWRLLGQLAADMGMAGVAEELAARMLRSAGAAVTGVVIDELVTEATTPPPRRGPELSSAPPLSAARIEFSGPGGAGNVMARLGYGLALAAAAGAPVRVAGAVMDRLAVLVQDGDLLGPFLDQVPAPAPLRAGPRMRFEPRNLSFGDGLDRWEFGGSFRREAGQSHRQEYSCTAGSGCAVLSSAVAEPHGSAGLHQAIAADDYRDATVTFRGDWARYEVTAQVPADGGIIRFGIFLAGRGRVGLRNAELVRGG